MSEITSIVDTAIAVNGAQIICHVTGPGERHYICDYVALFTATDNALAAGLHAALSARFPEARTGIRCVRECTPDRGVVICFAPAAPQSRFPALIPSIVEWFETQGVAFDSDAYEVMSAAHFERDSPAEFKKAMREHFSASVSAAVR